MNELAWLLATRWGGYSPFPSARGQDAALAARSLSTGKSETGARLVGANSLVAGAKELGVILDLAQDATRRPLKEIRAISNRFPSTSGETTRRAIDHRDIVRLYRSLYRLSLSALSASNFVTTTS